MATAGLTADPWQDRVLTRQADRELLMCTRQAGKSSIASLRALHTAMCKPNSLVLLLSPTERQSGELFRDKLLNFYRPVKDIVPARRETALTLELTNGSRIYSLPENEKGIRGFSGVRLLVIDEASRVEDSLYRAVRPMLAVSGGSLLALSTPFGKRGWFFEEWESDRRWSRVRVTAEQCPRIKPEFLAEERKAMGLRWYRQEYECSFEDTVDAVFAWSDIQAALVDEGDVFFPELATSGPDTGSPFGIGSSREVEAW